MALESIDSLYQRAVERKGGEKRLKQLIEIEPPEIPLEQLTDDRVLAAFTKKVFQSGFVWRVVENKWPNFEENFFNFNIEKILMMPEEMLERKASDPGIIRNYNKVKTIKGNAQMIYEHQQDDRSFAQLICEWPGTDIIGLWAFLKKHGQRLGGNTGPYALRAMGIDTFLVSRDVEAYFRAHDIITGGVQTKSSLKAIQDSFNQWHQASGRSFAQLSRLVAMATGDNHIQAE